MSGKKDIKRLVTAARKAGWKVTTTNNSHTKICPPTSSDGKKVCIFVSGSPSDARGTANARSLLRKYGLKV